MHRGGYNATPGRTNSGLDRKAVCLHAEAVTHTRSMQHMKPLCSQYCTGKTNHLMYIIPYITIHDQIHLNHDERDELVGRRPHDLSCPTFSLTPSPGYNALGRAGYISCYPAIILR